jgi:hypothetical protein
MQRILKLHFILLNIEFLNIKIMAKNYIKKILKIFPDIASGRKNFKYFEKRIKKNLILTHKYHTKKQIFSQK